MTQLEGDPSGLVEQTIFAFRQTLLLDLVHSLG